MLQSRMAWVLLFCGLLIIACPVDAVVLNSEDGAKNTEAPNDDPGFANVGILNAGSAVYLGNRWVLTAVHVGAGAVSFDGVEYPNIVDQTIRLENDASDLTPSTDIALLRLQDDPGLPALRLGCRSVSVNTDVVLVGGGRDRAADLTHWFREDVAGENNDIWTLAASEGETNESGYFTTDSRTVRWGTSRVTANNFEADSGKGDVSSFQTDFLAPGPIVASSAQAVRGDSGGAVFQKNGGVWELVGMIHAVGLKEQQPLRTDTAVLGGSSYHAELFDYADQLRSLADFEPAPGDFDGDGEITSAELDELLDAINSDQLNSCHYDLTGNGSVTHSDFDVMLTEAGTLVGDANLDGKVAFDDFLTVARAYGQGDVGWARGDFDGDNDVTFGDFLLLSRNFGESFTSQAVSVSAVPEPSASAMFRLLVCLGMVFARHLLRRTMSRQS